MEGYIHSIESMGLVDGPGIRTVVFFQGCALRCSFCHNPDTWKLNEGKKMSVKDLVKKIKRFEPYFKRSNGGVTLSGGDPLMQKDFLLELLKELKKENIHVALDTAGHGDGDYDEILDYVDLVLLDIKEVEEKKYLLLTKGNIKKHEEFLSAVQRKNVPLWIRHVVVPGITDGEEHLELLANKISYIENVEKIELLPYHSMGKEKYKKLNMPYVLDGIDDMDRKLCRAYQDKLINRVDELRQEREESSTKKIG